jgi:hypothetical protein
MAKKQMATVEEAPTLRSAFDFLYEVEHDYENKSYGDGSAGLNQLRLEYEKLKLERESRVEEIVNKDSKIIKLDEKMEEISQQITDTSVWAIKTARRLKRALNARGLTGQLLKEIQEFEQQLAAV